MLDKLVMIWAPPAVLATALAMLSRGHVYAFVTGILASVLMIVSRLSFYRRLRSVEGKMDGLQRWARQELRGGQLVGRTASYVPTDGTHAAASKN